MNLDAIYAPTSIPAEQLAALRLPLMTWRLYRAITAESKPKTARALAQDLGVSPDGMAGIVEQLQGAGLIHVPEFSYEEFNALEVPPPPAESATETGPAGLPATAPASTSVSFTLRKRGKHSSTSAQFVNGQTEVLNVGTLVALIREKYGGGSLGQLAVYRMFLKIPQELLETAGIQDLDLDAADVEISHLPLAAALRRQAADVLEVSEQELVALLSEQARSDERLGSTFAHG